MKKSSGNPNCFEPTVHTAAGVTRIDVPPTTSFRSVWKYIAWISILGSFATGLAVASIHQHELAIPAIQYAFITVLVIYFMTRRLRRHIVFEIDCRTLRLMNVTRHRRIEERSWRRDEVRGARIIENGKLWLRARGRDAAEIYLTPSRDANEHIASAINTALAAEFSALGDESPQLWYASEAEPSASGNKVFLGIAFALATAGVLVLIFASGFRALSVILFFLAAVPAGISLGTQENKTFYF